MITVVNFFQGEFLTIKRNIFMSYCELINFVDRTSVDGSFFKN